MVHLIVRYIRSQFNLPAISGAQAGTFASSQHQLTLEELAILTTDCIPPT